MKTFTKADNQNNSIRGKHKSLGKSIKIIRL